MLRNLAFTAGVIIASALPFGICGAEPGAGVAPGQMDNFSISGMGERGKKNWDIAGKSADIGAQVIKLNDVQGTMYGDNATVRLTAKQGDFDRQLGQLHLEKDVVVTTSTGATLTTDELNWDKKAQIVSTPAQVNIEKEDMRITAQGAQGEPALSKVDLEKDVRVRIADGQPRKSQEPVAIRCDGPLQIDYAADTAVFNNNVLVVTRDCRIESDILEIYFRRDQSPAKIRSGDIGSSKIDRIVARKNVKITRNGDVSYCEEATYTASDRKISLAGNPRLVIYPTGEQDASSGS